MKICIFAWQFLPIQGGQEYGLHYLANALGCLGHEVEVVTRRWPWPDSVDKSQIPTGRYTVRHFRWLRTKALLDKFLAGFYLRREKRRFDFDVLLAKMAWPAGYWAGLQKKVLGTPLVIGVVGIDIQKLPALGRGFRLISPKVEQQIRDALQEADAVLAYTPSIRTMAIEAGAVNERAKVIPNGVDVATYMAAALPKDAKPYILGIGRFVSIKGHDVLLRAFRKVADANENIQLVLVGGQPVPPEYESLVQELRLDDRVTFIEFVAGEEKAALIKGSTLFVQPSLSEAVPLAILEAMAAERPIVASNVGGIPEVVEDGGNGILVEPGDVESLATAIIDLVDDETSRERMGKRSLELALPFDWSHIARQYVRLFEDLLKDEDTTTDEIFHSGKSARIEPPQEAS